MNIQELFRQTSHRLNESGIELPELEADWIVGHFSKTSSAQRIANPDLEISKDIFGLVEDAVERRLQGEPLAYVLGEKDFYGLTFKVGPGVLIPRPDTERLVEWALTFCAQRPQKKIRILDLGTGSGCIGLTLIHHFDNAQLTAVDISEDALVVARENARQLQLEDRVRFVKMDAACAVELGEKFDLVVANPPYIASDDTEVASEVKAFEPHLALFAPGNGLETLTKWAENLHMICNEESAVGFEIGYRQGEAVMALFKRLELFSKVYVLKDFSGLDRVVCGER